MSRHPRLRASSSYLCLAFLAACGGTTGSDGDGGTAAAGASSSAGKSSGGSSAAGHTGDGGTSRGGASAGSGGIVSITPGGAGGSGGIVIITPGGAGGGGTAPVDPRCPAQRPGGICAMEDAGLTCQYSVGDNCLCYPTAPGTFAFCQKVDPACPQSNVGGAGSIGGSAGAGGVSAKVALPPRQHCTCTSGNWSCAFGT